LGWSWSGWSEAQQARQRSSSGSSSRRRTWRENPADADVDAGGTEAVAAAESAEVIADVVADGRAVGGSGVGSKQERRATRGPAAPGGSA
jgi:hypothetical protein